MKGGRDRGRPRKREDRLARNPAPFNALTVSPAFAARDDTLPSDSEVHRVGPPRHLDRGRVADRFDAGPPQS